MPCLPHMYENNSKKYLLLDRERPPRRQPSTSSTRSLAKSPEPRSARVAEAREHPPETAVLRPGHLGEGEPEVAVGVGPELHVRKPAPASSALIPAGRFFASSSVRSLRPHRRTPSGRGRRWS